MKKNDNVCAEIVYSSENPAVKSMSKDELYKEIDAYIKSINKTLPLYKYVREFFLTEEPLIKTTTQKIKRHEEIKKIMNSK